MFRKLALSCLFVASAAGLGLYLSRGPWQTYRDQRAKADEATREMESAEHEKADLLKRRAEIETPMGREKLARERGYLKKGELPVNSEH